MRMLHGGPDESFNPCFSGMAFGTPIKAGAQVTLYMFQSLFFWNGLWDTLTSQLPRTGAVFQSLFFWNGLWDMRSQILVSSPMLGFNPCFSGMAFGTGWGTWGRTKVFAVSILVFLEWPLGQSAFPPYIDATFLFQSLFFWNGLWDDGHDVHDGAGVFGFNPCFSGMAFGTAIIDAVMQLVQEVSILVFLEWPLGRSWKGR